MLMGRNARTGPVDLFVLGLITVVAGFVRIHRIDSPRTPIFDESYAGYITNRYRHGNEYFFDLHPPFGRLVQYYVGVVALGAPECMYTKVVDYVVRFGARTSHSLLSSSVTCGRCVSSRVYAALFSCHSATP
jgi:dolichyl-phosphate-mannose--protein O-mannosyl transferase